MTRIAEKLNLAYHGCKESEKPELFADVEQWLQEMDDRSGARPPVTHTGRGRCIHNVPICGECQTRHVLAHVADIERARNEVAATPPDTPVVAREIAADIVRDKDIWHLFNPASDPVMAHDRLIDRLAAIITKRFAATTSPSETAVPDALLRASKVCRSTIPGARVELIFQSLEDAQAVHKWLSGLTASETAVGGEARRCVKCRHYETVDLHDEGECQVQGQSGFICGCKCEFRPTCLKCGHNTGVERTLKRCKARIDGGEALCKCHCVFPAAPVPDAGDNERKSKDKSNYYWHGPQEDKTE